jgi:sporulation protein YlmC with PRC-barrel domain
LGGVGASATTSGSMYSSSNVRLSEIMNKPVQSQEGKTLGYIRDLTVNPQSGQIEFAVLSLSGGSGATSSSSAAADTSTSGRETAPSSRSSVTGTPGSTTTAGMTGKLIPVPWQLFSQSWSGSSRLGTSSSSVAGTTTSGSGAAGNLTLNLDESKLRSAPSFDSSNWNQLQGGTFDQRVYSYFGVDRASGTGTPGSTIRGQGTSGSYDHTSPQGSSSRGSSSQGTTGSQDRNQGNQGTQGTSPDRSSTSPDRSTTSPDR